MQTLTKLGTAWYRSSELTSQIYLPDYPLVNSFPEGTEGMRGSERAERVAALPRGHRPFGPPTPSGCPARRSSTQGKGQPQGLPLTRTSPGFAKAPRPNEIAAHGYILTPGRYVGAEAQQDDGERFDEKMRRLAAQWREQQAEACGLDEAIARNLKELGYDG